MTKRLITLLCCAVQMASAETTALFRVDRAELGKRAEALIPKDLAEKVKRAEADEFRVFLVEYKSAEARREVEELKEIVRFYAKRKKKMTGMFYYSYDTGGGSTRSRMYMVYGDKIQVAGARVGEGNVDLDYFLKYKLHKYDIEIVDDRFTETLEKLLKEERNITLADSSVGDASGFANLWLQERLSQIAEAGKLKGDRNKWRVIKQEKHKDIALRLAQKKIAMVDLLAEIAKQSDSNIVLSRQGFILSPAFVRLDTLHYKQIKKGVYLERPIVLKREKVEE